MAILTVPLSRKFIHTRDSPASRSRVFTCILIQHTHLARSGARWYRECTRVRRRSLMPRLTKEARTRAVSVLVLSSVRNWQRTLVRSCKYAPVRLYKRTRARVLYTRTCSLHVHAPACNAVSQASSCRAQFTCEWHARVYELTRERYCRWKVSVVSAKIGIGAPLSFRDIYLQKHVINIICWDCIHSWVQNS